MTATVTRLLLLAVLVLNSEGQLFNSSAPNLAEITKQLTTVVADHPLTQLGSKIFGGGLEKSVELFSRIPLMIARAAQESGLEFSTLDKYFQRNNGQSNAVINRYIKEFNAGSGNEDANLRIDQLMSKYGYPVEEHKVETEDGYILTMFRIPGKGPPVFLMHGLLGSADDFTIGGPNNSLAYLLADRKYDVWMGNARGNKHSRSHKELEPSQSDFWDFTWNEIGVYDLPAMIDYVFQHNKSGQKVKYIGHSQGTTSFFVFLSERPEYNEKISQMVALSPVAFMGKVKSPLVRVLAPGGSLIYSLSNVIGMNELLPDNEIMKYLRTALCGSSGVSFICNNMVFLVTGFDFKQLNVSNLPVMFGHLPAGCSMKQLLHYGQGVISAEFRKFDFGNLKNMFVYGSQRPPRYNLQKVKVPIALFYSDEDWLAHPDDVETLYENLGNQDEIDKVFFPGFNHLDFVFAKYFNELVFPQIEKVFQIYSDK